jgi:hypothetical protein
MDNVKFVLDVQCNDNQPVEWGFDSRKEEMNVSFLQFPERLCDSLNFLFSSYRNVSHRDKAAGALSRSFFFI